MKPCRICRQQLPYENFYAEKTARDGYRNECKDCTKILRKNRYDSASAVARAQEWREKNPERSAAYQAEYRNRPERKRKMRDLYYKRTYGLSADEVDAMWEAQGRRCLLCGCSPERLASMHLDHDHVTGRIRGLLCLDCNQGIGKLGDDPETLERAAEYIRRHRAAA